MKTKSLFILLMIFTLLTGCSSSSFKSREKKFEFRGNAGTGYDWNCIIEDESVIWADEKTEYLGDTGMTGGPVIYSYTVHSLKPGSTKMQFVYKRPWESTSYDETRFYEVTVKENGSILMTEKEAGKVMVTFKSVTMNEGLDLMKNDSGFILLDVRRPDEYAAGHIPGAVQLTNETMTESEALKVIPDKNQTVYVYCRSGRRSKEASKKLTDWGWKNIIEIGGILDYSGPVEK